MYKGGCHCGAVRYTTEMDEITKGMTCNCSHCHKKGVVLSFIPATQFTLESGEEHLTEYRFNKKVIRHLFCNICGVQSFGRGTMPDGTETVALNLRCIDDLDLKTLEITEYNGKNA